MKGAAPSTGRTQVENNGISIHFKETMHRVNWDGFTHLDSDRVYKSGKAKESIYIKSLVGVENSVKYIPIN